MTTTVGNKGISITALGITIRRLVPALSGAEGWLSVDPILKQHESPYSFTSNNPIMLIDPDGRDTTFASRAAQDRFNAAYSNTLNKMESLEKKIDKKLDKFIGGELSSKSERKYMNDLQKIERTKRS